MIQIHTNKRVHISVRFMYFISLHDYLLPNLPWNDHEELSLLLVLGIITGRHEQVGQDQKLVICELLLVLLPVVVVRPPKI